MLGTRKKNCEVCFHLADPIIFDSIKSLFFFFRLSEFFFYPLLARPDVGAGVEQPFGCLIVQNRQAV